MIMIHKIISGGQTGADIAALRVAKHLGIKTGGFMPKGWKTLDGPRPEYRTLYNMQEHSSGLYSERTRSNVGSANATLAFASDFSSPGEICTRKACESYNCPYLPIFTECPLPHDEVVSFLQQNHVVILNIAGNSEKTSPGIEKFVYNYLLKLLTIPGVARGANNACRS